MLTVKYLILCLYNGFLISIEKQTNEQFNIPDQVVTWSVFTCSSVQRKMITTAFYSY